MDGRCTKNPRKNHQISYKSARPPVIQVHSLKLTQSLKDRPSQKESRLPTSNHQFSAQKSRPTVHWWKQEWTVRRPNTKIPRCQPFNKKETIHFRGGHHIHSLAAMEEESAKATKALWPTNPQNCYFLSCSKLSKSLLSSMGSCVPVGFWPRFVFSAAGHRGLW